ncbi:sulfate permease family domain-containing protein [Ditylenchus destructor]|uniref:Sulfate permease family domain-containing protein n=1 Tax=Ditylenchus destructor TaxID=166010 RepID=A0AAD4R4H4_9BILA|nr:sulfate permease family domain-containing protein [Ditylenchus destructor]
MRQEVEENIQASGQLSENYADENNFTVASLLPRNDEKPILCKVTIENVSSRDDKEFVEFGSNPQGFLRSLAQNCLAPCKNGQSFLTSIIGFVPILNWLPKYAWKENLMADLVAGATTGVMHVPQGIAYALLSGVQPVNGLYASFFAPLFYMIFGTSRHVSIGSFAVVALMSGVTNEQIMSKYYGTNFTYTPESFQLLADANVNPISIASTLTFTLGLIQLATALLKLEFLSAYFCDPLVGGFTTGAAVHVFFSQIDDIMGIKLTRVSGPGYLFVVGYRLIKRIPDTNLVTLTSSAIAGTFLVVGKDFITPLLNKQLQFRVIIPYELLVLIVATFISYIFQWHETYGAPVMNYEKDLDAGQELYALGFSSTFSGFFPVFPTSTALGRTMVNVESGAKTQFSNVFSCLLLLGVILFLGPLFRTLPLCMLSTVIVVALRPMFRKFNDLPRIWRISKHDFFIWVVSFCATVAIDVIGGLAVSVGVALLTVVIRTQWPRWYAQFPQSSTLKERPDYCIYRFESFLIFTNVSRFRCTFTETIEKWNANRRTTREDKGALNGKHLIFDCSAITQIDCMGVSALADAIGDVHKRYSMRVFFTDAKENIRRTLVDSNIVSNEDCFVSNIDRAIDLIARPKTTAMTLPIPTVTSL